MTRDPSYSKFPPVQFLVHCKLVFIIKYNERLSIKQCYSLILSLSFLQIPKSWMLTASMGLIGRLLQRERNRLKMYHSIHPYGVGKTSVHTRSLLSSKRFNSNFAFSYRSLSCNDLASATLQDNMSVHSSCHLNEKQLPRMFPSK